MEFHGTQLGRSWGGPIPLQARYGFNEEKISAISCTFIEIGSRIECITAKGVGADCAWILIIDGMEIHVLGMTTSYREPILQSVIANTIESSTKTTNLQTKSGDKLIVHGNYFGPIGLNVSVHS